MKTKSRIITKYQKIILTLIIGILFSNYLIAQHWQPFVKEQVSYYKQPINNSRLLNIEMYSITELETDSGTVNYIQGTFLKNDCYNDALNELYVSWNWGYDVYDRYVQRDSLILFLSNVDQNTIFKFKPYSKKGESWMSNGKTITCTNETIFNVFEISDSIKIFNWDGIEQIVLSKNHGFLKFSAPLGRFVSNNHENEFELIGYSGTNGKKGYQIPEFNEFFNLNKGDVLYYECMNAYGEEYVDETNFDPFYYKDSIINCHTSNEFVQYNIHREAYDNNFHLIKKASIEMSFTYENEGKLIDSQTSWLSLFTTNIDDELIYKTLQLDINQNDTVTYVTGELTRASLSDCGIAIMTDYPYGMLQISDKEGITINQLVYNEGFTPNWFKSTLIGSVINGVEKGTTIKTSVKQNALFSNTLIFPNPVSNTLYINSNSEEIEWINIYSLTGNLIIKEYRTNTVDVSQIKSGVYLLEICEKNKNCMQLKLLKQ